VPTRQTLCAVRWPTSCLPRHSVRLPDSAPLTTRPPATWAAQHRVCGTHIRPSTPRLRDAGHHRGRARGRVEVPCETRQCGCRGGCPLSEPSAVPSPMGISHVARSERRKRVRLEYPHRGCTEGARVCGWVAVSVARAWAFRVLKQKIKRGGPSTFVAGPASPPPPSPTRGTDAVALRPPPPLPAPTPPLSLPQGIRASEER